MLYGVSPLLFTDNLDESYYGLKAVMSFYAPIIAVHNFQAGQALGYGSTWTCPENMPVAVVACGYADGYPRHAASGTPVWLNGCETQVIGRVSMDMIMIDLRGVTAEVGDTVELWGKHLAVNRVAQSSQTIAYELLCHVGNQCPQRSS
jgi:alanine racemase